MLAFKPIAELLNCRFLLFWQPVASQQTGDFNMEFIPGVSWSATVPAYAISRMSFTQDK
jgi:hypothetical protein